MKHWLVLFSLLALGAQAADIDPFKTSVQSVHQIKLLNHGLGSLEERLQMLERAQNSIDVEYFIYNLDKSGKLFSQALIKKAQQGVKVRMLLDFAMIKGTFSPFYAEEMKAFGIDVRYFNPTATLNLFSGTYRNHRKVLLIDGKEAITGGRNIGDEYFDLREDFNFLDRDIFISGDIVKSIQQTFDQVWNAEQTLPVARARRPEANDGIYRQQKGGNDQFRYRQDLRAWNEKIKAAKAFLTVADNNLLDSVRAKGLAELQNEYSGTCENMTFNSEYPIIGKKNRSERIIKHNIAERITNAKESVLFDSPYFIVNDESKVALETALANKVKVTLLTNSLNSTDAVYVYDVFDSIVKDWIKKGMESYIYKGSLPENYPTISEEVKNARFGVHAKSFVFDKKDVVIGTFNFDPRSANLNTEMTISCDNNPELARLVTEDIEGRIKSSILLDSSKKVDEAEFFKVGLLKRIEYYVLKGPSNLFDYLL
jgi:putative cardiolipin synthase